MKAFTIPLGILLLGSLRAESIDPVSGMKMAENWRLVQVNCTGCHSAQQFTRQRGTRRTWQEMIRWMQASQGLWELDKETEEKILTYLATHYGPGKEWRRAPLPGNLLPKNPYESEIRKNLPDELPRPDPPGSKPSEP